MRVFQACGSSLGWKGIKITTPKGKVIRPGDYLKLPGEGMPKSTPKNHGSILRILLKGTYT